MSPQVHVCTHGQSLAPERTQSFAQGLDSFLCYWEKCTEEWGYLWVLQDWTSGTFATAPGHAVPTREGTGKGAALLPFWVSG